MSRIFFSLLIKLHGLSEHACSDFFAIIRATRHQSADVITPTSPSRLASQLDAGQLELINGAWLQIKSSNGGESGTAPLTFSHSSKLSLSATSRSRESDVINARALLIDDVASHLMLLMAAYVQQVPFKSGACASSASP